MTDAKDDEFPNMVSSPSLPAVICPDSAVQKNQSFGRPLDPKNNPSRLTNDSASDFRLVQDD